MGTSKTRAVVVGIIMLFFVVAAVAAAYQQRKVLSGSEDSASKAQATNVIATVNGEPIYESEIVNEMRAGAPGSRNDVLDAYVSAVLAAQGVEQDHFIEDLQYAKRKVLAAAYLQQTSRKLDQAITDEQIKSYYDKQVVNAAFDKYAVSYYLTQDPGDANDRLMEFKAGRSLDKLKPVEFNRERFIFAKDLPYATGQLVAQMKKGEIISQPRIVKDGFLILRLDDTQKGAKPSIDAIKQDIKVILVQQQLAETMKGRRKSADVRINK